MLIYKITNKLVWIANFVNGRRERITFVIISVQNQAHETTQRSQNENTLFWKLNFNVKLVQSQRQIFYPGTFSSKARWANFLDLEALNR